MKNRDEYFESIYAKRDAKIKEHKKRISVLTGVLCLGICFASVFTFVPKYFEAKTSLSENKNNSSDKHILTHSGTTSEIQAGNAELFTFYETYPVIYYQNHGQITNEVGNRNMNNSEIKASKKNNETPSDNKLQTEIAVEIPVDATTRQTNFGYVGEPFNPELIYSKPSLEDSAAVAPDDTPEDYYTAVTEPYSIPSDSASVKSTISSTSAKNKSSEEAIAKAKTYVSEEDVTKIIDDKTHVTITRTANGKSSYTVYFYTESKSITVELNAVTLHLMELKEKNLISGYESYYSPPHLPETTAALPEYMPQ